MASKKPVKKGAEPAPKKKDKGKMKSNPKAKVKVPEKAKAKSAYVPHVEVKGQFALGKGSTYDTSNMVERACTVPPRHTFKVPKRNGRYPSRCEKHAEARAEKMAIKIKSAKVAAKKSKPVKKTAKKKSAK